MAAGRKQRLFQIGVTLKHLISDDSGPLHQPEDKTVAQDKEGLFEKRAQWLHRHETARESGSDNPRVRPGRTCERLLCG